MPKPQKDEHAGMEEQAGTGITGVNCVQVAGLTVIEVQPNPKGMALSVVVPASLFIIIGYFMLDLKHSISRPMMGLILAGFLIALLLSAYVTFFKNDVFVISTDWLEKRWSCKPFFWRSRFRRKEIASVSVGLVTYRTQTGPQTLWILELVKTDGGKVRLIRGGEKPRLEACSKYLNRALFPPARAGM